MALVIWASYGFRYGAFAPELTNEATRFHVTWDSVNEGLPPYVRATLQAAHEYHLLPEPFLFGFAYTLFTGAGSSFLDGVYYIQGTARFFPCCFAWKTPLATFVVLLMAAWACRLRGKRRSQQSRKTKTRAPWWYPLTPLLVLWIIYWGTAVTSSLNIGHRQFCRPIHRCSSWPAGRAMVSAMAVGAQRHFNDRRSSRGGFDRSRIRLVRPRAANDPGGTLDRAGRDCSSRGDGPWELAQLPGVLQRSVRRPRSGLSPAGR